MFWLTLFLVYVRKRIKDDMMKHLSSKNVGKTEINKKIGEFEDDFDSFFSRYIEDVTRARSDVPFQKHVISCLKKYFDPREDRSLLNMYTSDDSRLLQEAYRNKKNNHCCSMCILYIYMLLCK